MNLISRVGMTFFISTMLTLTACVTINVYFPASQAERAAERIVDEILGESEKEKPIEEQPEKDAQLIFKQTDHLLASLSTLLISEAVAAQPDFSVNTPAIKRLQSSMANRHTQLAKYYDSGAIGFDNRGLVAIKDQSQVTLKQRGTLNSLLRAENKDRNALYKAIADANGHPEWEKDVRAVFAKKWIEKAHRGWWYQDAKGNWRQQ